MDETYTGRKCQTYIFEKAAIAYYIADKIIKDGSSAFFDAGSTLRIVTRATYIRAKKRGLKLIITTNNFDISDDFMSKGKPYSLDEPSANIDVILQLTGGKHDRQHHALFGRLAAFTLDRIYPECIFMGITGFSFRKGLFYHGATEEEAIKRALYSKEVDRRVLAFDHSKLGQLDMFLCENNEGEAIEGLCKNVRDKTIVVTSEPYDEEDESKGKQPWYQQELEDIPRNSFVQDALNKGKLEIIVVSFVEEDPYYRLERRFPSADST